MPRPVKFGGSKARRARQAGKLALDQPDPAPRRVMLVAGVAAIRYPAGKGAKAKFQTVRPTFGDDGLSKLLLAKKVTVSPTHGRRLRG